MTVKKKATSKTTKKVEVMDLDFNDLVDFSVAMSGIEIQTFFKLRRINKRNQCKIFELLNVYAVGLMAANGIIKIDLNQDEIEYAIDHTIDEVVKLIKKGIIYAGDFNLLMGSFSTHLVLNLKK
jgi:hypothetical protein